MNETNPFDDLFDKMYHLLSFIKDHSHIPPQEWKIPPDLEKRLEKLKKKIDKFNSLSNDIVKLSGISEEELKMRLGGVSKEIPPEGRRLIQRSHQIKSEVQDFNEELEQLLKHVPLSERFLAAQAQKPEAKILDDKEYSKKRRNKFKRFGGDQNWKPL